MEEFKVHEYTHYFFSAALHMMEFNFLRSVTHLCYSHSDDEIRCNVYVGSRKTFSGHECAQQS